MRTVGAGPLPGLGGRSPGWPRLAEAVLRGVGQVDFQNNWATGLVILAAIFYNSPVYGVACLVGVATATLTALALRADRAAVDAGLFGFNGVLLAIGLVAYLSPNFARGAWPGWQLWLFVVFGAAFTAVVTAALMAVGERCQLPTLTWPFNITAWLFLFAALKFARLHTGPGIAPALPAAFHGPTGPYTVTTLYQGVGNGIAEVFFQDNWISGYIMLAGLAVSSLIAAGMALTGALLGAATAMALGAPAADIQAGLFGFNSVLTALALGGVFFALTLRGLLYAIFATIITAWVWAAVTVALAPVGMPAFTGPFCIVATLAILAKWRLPGLVPVPPA